MIEIGIIIKHDQDNNIPIATDDKLNLSPMGLSAVEEKEMGLNFFLESKRFLSTL